MDRIDPVSKQPVRPPLETEVEGGDSHLAEDVDRTEDLNRAEEADDLEQDPDEVPNRTEEPAPPEEEEVGPKN